VCLWTASKPKPSINTTPRKKTPQPTKQLANLVVNSDAAALLDALAAWTPVEPGLLLSAEQRSAAIGEDVSGQA
jgi:hypothetical protein